MTSKQLLLFSMYYRPHISVSSPSVARVTAMAVQFRSTHALQMLPFQTSFPCQPILLTEKKKADLSGPAM
jgi:hypothetical protein